MQGDGLRRRDFLRACAGGAAVLVWGGWVGCQKRESGQSEGRAIGGWPLGMQSYSLRKFDVIEAIRITKELGLNHVEIFPGHLPPDSAEERVKEVRQALSQHGVTLNAYGVVRLSADEAANRAYFDFARKMGFHYLSADPDPDDECMRVVEKLVEEYDVKIAIHNHGPTSRYSTVEDILKVVDGRHPHVGACVDTGHFLRSNVDPAEAIRRLGDRVHGVHLKDWGGVEGEWPVFGEGKLDMVAVFTAMREIGFSGFISIEYEAHPDDPVEYLRKCVQATREAAAKAG